MSCLCARPSVVFPLKVLLCFYPSPTKVLVLRAGFVMIRTPKCDRMVRTRNTIRKAEQRDTERDSVIQPSSSKNNPCQSETLFGEKKMPVSPRCVTRSHKSTTSSVEARRKRLEYEAAQAKAKIEIELIQKRLAADLAELDDEVYSPRSEGEEQNPQVEVDNWLEQNQHVLQEVPAAPLTGINPGQLDPPLPTSAPQAAGASNTENGTIQMLASAIKDLATISSSNGSNAPMLSRLCMPRELPGYSGNPLEWLNFKQAFEESTKVCNFSDQENLWRLRKCLHGPAKDAVAALLISGSSPANVMSTLELQFGNPEIILSRLMYDIKNLQPMSEEYHKYIVIFSIKIKNFVAAVCALSEQEYLKGTSIASIILSKLPPVLISKWADYSYKIIMETQKPKLVLLSEFLNEEAIKISKTSVTVSKYNPSAYKRKQSDSFANLTHAVLVQNNIANDNCRFCHTSRHNLPECKKFRKALRKDRWQFVKRTGLCFKCLVSRHKRESCAAPVCDKDNCGQSHHKLLHYVYDREQQAGSLPIGDLPVTLNEQVHEPRSENIMHVKVNSCRVLLKTVPICVHSPNGKINTVALLDDGSTVSIVSDNLVKRLGIHGCKQTLRVRGAWDCSDLVCSSQIVNLNISNLEETMFQLQVRSTNGLNLPSQYLSINELMCNDENFINVKHLLCDRQIKREILIGQDNYNLLVPQQIIKCKPDGPYLTRTLLGWCVHGRAPSSHKGRHSMLCLANESACDDGSLHELHEAVKKSFSIEALGISAAPRPNYEHVKAIEHLERTAILKDGRWHVGLPWRDPACRLPESYKNACSRLKGVEKKCKANPTYMTRYTDRINHLLENDYAYELLDLKASARTWYLPHFGVDNPNKNKLRLVFDAAATSNGHSLNDYLMTGPDLLTSLYGIMLKFRENKVAVTGDIRDTFLRIKILPEDQDALRFLWNPLGSAHANIKPYAMSSLIFGANCSPFIAQFIKNKNAKAYESSHPEAVQAICKQHYADDYIDSLEDSSKAIKLIKDIAHRLREIDDLTSYKDWHYIRTSLNAANIATRDGCDLDTLKNQWLHGPNFLYTEKHKWPVETPGEICNEYLEQVTLISKDGLPVPDPERFSSWLRLLRATCVVLSFIDKCKKLTGDISGDMMRRAERLLILYSQSQSFAEDMKNLKNKNKLERKSRLLALSPYIDELGILRVGGRINAASGIPPETKNPIILDGRQQVTKLIVRYYHVQAAHGNRETVVNNLKQKYWVIRMRPTVKHIASQCMFCRIKRAQPQPQRMGDLPVARMAHYQRPFTHCGVDLFGPMEVTVGRRRERRYGVLFTCLTVRAIHIELVSDLTTDTFIMALRRMAARRGWPQYIYSDNGTNFRGADNELKRSIKDLNHAQMMSEAANYGTTWTFSPPASPHWGGAWERLIRSVKQTLKVVLKERAPRDEVLSTLMVEIEQMINSRPLTHVSVEPHTDESLTPNHFLLQSSSGLPCVGIFDESDIHLRRQWRISQRLADLFWKRWVREVLPEMRPRTKWQHDSRPLQVGDLVLIVDPNSPRNVWPRGRIEAVMPGQDGRVRVVDIRTKSGLLRRAATRVALIPTGNEC